MRGRIVFNGNFPDEAAFPGRVAQWLRDPRHVDPVVRESRRVLLVTAGWTHDEYSEAHVKRALGEAGIGSRMVDGYDVNIQNLSAWHAFEEFQALEPEVASRWRARERLVETTRSLYQEKNAFHVSLLRRTLANLRERSPSLRLGDVLRETSSSFTHPPDDFDDDRLLAHFLAQDMRDIIATLSANDDQMVANLRVLDEHFVAAAGLHYNPTWQRLRAGLERRLLDASAIFMFGGDLGAMHRCLTFFRLRDAFLEAVRRGASIFAVSAGALLLCDRIIVYNDFPSAHGPRREFQLFDRGFALVRQLQIFPHCMDRIQTDDEDNLSYLAYRFQHRTCVGLNEESFLLVETAGDDGSGARAISAGHGDGVYVFDRQGRKQRYDYGQAVLADGASTNGEGSAG